MTAFKLKTPVLGVIYGNRDFFPDQLVTEARAARFWERSWAA
jgi:hypothetical protein